MAAKGSPSFPPSRVEAGTTLLPEIGARLIQIRGDWSQADFAPCLGVHKNTLGAYERGEREVGALVLMGLWASGWNINWVLSGEGNERNYERQYVQMLAEAESSQAVSAEHLSIAVELADEALKGLWLPRNRYYDLVALIYDGLTQGLPYAEIIDFARPAATKLAKERDDDGGTEVGGSREADPAGRQAGGDG